MPIYAHYGVSHAWLVDPEARILEAYVLEKGAWQEIGRFADEARVSIAPFEVVTIALGELWLPNSPPNARL